MPKVSVIIPVYNVEPYLRECLDSVVNQTLKDIEIICVNDGATDGSQEILEEYKDKDNRITVLVQSNSGAGVARNNGLNVANGEYIAFLDSDDFYKNDFCEKMYNKAIKTDSDIVICSVDSYDVNQNIYKQLPYSLKLSNLPQEEIFNAYSMQKTIFNSFQNWNFNKIFKHSFIKKNKIHFQELYRTNDLLFTCSALIMAKNITTLNESLTVYRIGMNTNCQSTNHLYPTDFYDAFMALRNFLKKRNCYSIYKYSFLNHFFAGCVHNLNSIKDKKTQKTLYKFLIANFQEDGIVLKNELKKLGYKQSSIKENIFLKKFTILIKQMKKKRINDFYKIILSINKE